jgi:hypothetical protein
MNPTSEYSLLFSDLLVRLTARQLVERFVHAASTRVSDDVRTPDNHRASWTSALGRDAP